MTSRHLAPRAGTFALGVAASTLVACGSAAPTASTASTVPAIAGRWDYLGPTGGGWTHRLTIRVDGRYTHASGALATIVGDTDPVLPGRIEHGHVQERDGVLQWQADSLETWELRVGQPPLRRVERPVWFIEGHPYANTRAMVRGDTLRLAGRNASIGALQDVEYRFVRVR